MQTVQPTTRAQVSGHRFLHRRVEHGLVFGDIRMIHDPLATRRRALVFGLVAVALIAAGAGVSAWLRPAADPGEAPVLQSAEGALFVRVDDRVHPVANLASARLVAGEATGPVRIGAGKLAEAERGVPLGIHPAPAVLHAEDTPDLEWAVCAGEGGPVTVVADASGRTVSPLGGHRGVLAVGGGADWLLTAEGRYQLPHPDSAEGRMMRRVLGVDAATPRWEPPPEVLSVVAEQDPLRVPVDLPEEVLVLGNERWVRVAEGVAPVTATQARMLEEVGVGTREITADELHDHPDATVGLRLPAHVPLWVDPAGTRVCATGEGRVGTLPAAGEGPAVPLAGDSVAEAFLGWDGAGGSAVAVDTGHGHHVIDTTGLRHPVPDRGDLAALGLAPPGAAPWPVIRLLPEGPELSGEAARRSSY